MLNNRVVLIVAAVLVILGIAAFGSGSGTQGLGLGEALGFLLLFVLKFLPYGRRGSVPLSFPLRRINWLLSLVALVGIIVIGKMAYTMYYQPMIQSLDSDPTAP